MSITSCLIRNDYNVLFSFLILAFIERIANENPKFYMKILIHLLIVLVIADILWLIVMSPYWSSVSQSKHWESLSTLHTIVIVLAYLEMFIKIAMGALIFGRYKRSYSNALQDLISLSYEKNLTVSEISK